MCKFQVGSYSYDDTKMVFVESERVKGYVETSRSIVLDYDVHIAPLSQQVGIRISSPSLSRRFPDFNHFQRLPRPNLFS